jgi:hypothetical protein
MGRYKDYRHPKHGSYDDNYTPQDRFLAIPATFLLRADELIE